MTEFVLDAAEPLIIMVAPNGARRTKIDHPALPMTADEIGEAAAQSMAAGASMLHLHVRDRDGRHLLDAEAYLQAIEAIRVRVGDGLIVQITTESVGIYHPAEQIAVVRAVRPQSASIGVRELFPDAAAEVEGAAFLDWMVKAGVIPQYILYSVDDIAHFEDLRRRGVIPGRRPFVLLVLGRYSAGQRSEPTDLLPLLAEPAGDRHWAVCAFGPRENACALAGATLGGHIRVGFENNLLLADGSPAASNADLVRQAAEGAILSGRELADATAAAALLALD